jgi:hypothetical protein
MRHSVFQQISSEEKKDMDILVAHNESPGIIYRVACQNAGCGHMFDLRITAKEARMLAGPIACPRCRRHGGILQTAGRIRDKVFSARLIFKVTGVGPTDEEGDLLTDIR